MDVRRDCISFARDQKESRRFSIHRANLTQAALAHPCARGIPFILNITAWPWLPD